MTEELLSTAADAELMRRIAAGDGDALGDWFGQFSHSLYSFVYYRVGNDPDLASDGTQATFTAALERLADFDPQRGDMTTWLRYLSRNIIRDLLQRHQRGAQLQTIWERIDDSMREAYQRIDSELLPEAVLVREETRELVEMALTNLPPHYRDLLEAKYIEDHSLEVMARLRETTTDSIKSTLRRARRAFRECFLSIAKMEMSDV